jgi:hypothetical protein
MTRVAPVVTKASKLKKAFPMMSVPQVEVRASGLELRRRGVDSADGCAESGGAWRSIHREVEALVRAGLSPGGGDSGDVGSAKTFLWMTAARLRPACGSGTGK